MTFGRLGKWPDVAAKIIEVKAAGGTVIRDRAAGTVIATVGTDEVFRALSKGAGVWIVLYSTKYYPRT